MSKICLQFSLLFEFFSRVNLTYLVILYVLIQKKSNQDDMPYVRLTFQCELSAPVIVACSVAASVYLYGGPSMLIISQRHCYVN